MSPLAAIIDYIDDQFVFAMHISTRITPMNIACVKGHLQEERPVARMSVKDMADLTVDYKVCKLWRYSELSRDREGKWQPAMTCKACGPASSSSCEEQDTKSWTQSDSLQPRG